MLIDKSRDFQNYLNLSGSSVIVILLLLKANLTPLIISHLRRNLLFTPRMGVPDWAVDACIALAKITSLQSANNPLTWNYRKRSWVTKSCPLIVRVKDIEHTNALASIPANIVQVNTIPLFVTGNLVTIICCWQLVKGLWFIQLWW